MTEKKEFCNKCDKDIFEVRFITDYNACDECHFNGYQVWTEDEEDWKWQYDEKDREDRVREQVEVTSSCMLGETYGHGCVFMCYDNCGNEQTMPFAGVC